MGNELIRLCDGIERHGLVDYQYGVWEDQITAGMCMCSCTVGVGQCANAVWQFLRTFWIYMKPQKKPVEAAIDKHPLTDCTRFHTRSHSRALRTLEFLDLVAGLLPCTTQLFCFHISVYDCFVARIMLTTTSLWRVEVYWAGLRFSLTLLACVLPVSTGSASRHSNYNHDCMAVFTGKEGTVYHSVLW